MTIWAKSRQTFAAALSATLLTLTPVWADDTEIFFGDVNNASTRPNVLFIIDTSGSMSGNVAGTGKDRLDNVKDAFRELLGSLNDVNVGLMRFSNPGGPILYPVSYIDGDVNEGAVIDVVATTTDGADDAQEGETTGVVEVGEDRLELVTLVLGSTETFADSVTSNADDTEEVLASGAHNNGGSQLDFFAAGTGTGGALQSIGVRFRGSDVPTGATIVNAYIRFTGRNDGNSDPVPALIRGERKDTGSFGGTFDLRDRLIANGTAAVPWLITEAVVGDETIDTPNIAPVVQAIVNDPSWNGDAGEEDDMVFIFTPDPTFGPFTGKREFFSRNGSNSRRPRLFIEYYVGTAPSVETALTGIRFRNVAIPKGVNITNAYVQFTAEQDTTGTFSYSIRGEDSSFPAPYAATANNISLRASTSAVTNWSGSGAVSSGTVINSPDISDVLEEITDRVDWCGGNDLALIVSGTDGLRTAWSTEGNASLAPRLVVQYEYDSIVPGASCDVKTISRRVVANTDDVEENGTTATTGGNVLNIRGTNLSGIRLTQLPIPQGSVIQSARLELTAQADRTGNTSIAIAVENTDNAQTYVSSDGTLEDRNYLAAVNWPITTGWDEDEVYMSPDLSTVVEQIVAQPGWSSGNAMAFKLTSGNNTERTAKTHNNSPAEAPRLIVTYQDDGSGKGERTARDELLDAVEELNHQGWTPIQDTLYEAGLYYRGENADHGTRRGGPNDGGPHAYTRVSDERAFVPGSFLVNRPAGCTENNLGDWVCRNETISGVGTGPTYESPITDACQENNHIIMLTDGFANRPHSEALIPTFIGEACLNEPTALPGGGTQNLSGGERCVKDLVRYMNENDLRPDSELTNQFVGASELTQRVTTHTIGFNFSSQWLEDVATAGGGVYTEASTATQLVQEIKSIIGDVLKTDSTFVAPVAAVNQFNRLNHLNQIYFALFRPDEFPRWPGNVKKYTLGANDNQILDATGAAAIDSVTGFFRDDSRSEWSPGVDGSKVDVGGAASQVPAYTSRKVFTHYAGSPSNVLSNAANKLEPGNSGLTKDMFGVATFTDGEFDELLDWTRGRDVDDEDDDLGTNDRYVLGDPLHSRPVAVTYGGTVAVPDVELFFGTNQGALHSVNAGSGAETFAFYPEATLPIQQPLRENEATTEHPYGMDGNVTPWINDNGNNGIDTGDALDFVRIYAGMRRGGRNYYGLDVTDRNNPELMWQIEGGVGDFAELGQSWSRPIVGKVNIGGTVKDVLFLSGGYDEAQDDAKVQTADSVGRAIFIVDALDGSLLWAGGKTGAGTWNEDFDDMDYSFPSSMSVGDVNGDDLADAIFVADMGGQLWRFDIRNGQAADDLVTGGVIADLGVAGGTNDIPSNRRFFHSPGVALVRTESGPQLNIVIGSGFRPSPLSVLATNRFFMIRQDAVFSAPAAYTKITAATLYDATANLLGTATGTDLIDEQNALAAAQGWFFDMPFIGEKVLSSPLITDGTVVFTSYQPGDSGVWCRPTAGTSRVYRVGLADALPLTEWVDSTGNPIDSRFAVLKTATIIDEPTLICTETGGCTTFIGTESPLPPLTPDDRIIKTFWRKDQ